jgi:phasin
MAKDTAMNFDLPGEMRVFVEKSMEQARQAFDSFMTATKEAVGNIESRADTARTGAKEVIDLAMTYSERNIAASFEFAQRLMQAKDAKEIAAIQNDYVTRQIAALTEQAKELGKQTAKLANPTT